MTSSALTTSVKSITSQQGADTISEMDVDGIDRVDLLLSTKSDEELQMMCLARAVQAPVTVMRGTDMCPIGALMLSDSDFRWSSKRFRLATTFAVSGSFPLLHRCEIQGLMCEGGNAKVHKAVVDGLEFAVCVKISDDDPVEHVDKRSRHRLMKPPGGMLRLLAWIPDHRAVCTPIDFQGESICAALASALYVKGITPFVVLSLEAAVVRTGDDSWGTTMLQELCGSRMSIYTKTSMADLSAFLHYSHALNGKSMYAVLSSAAVANFDVRSIDDHPAPGDLFLLPNGRFHPVGLALVWDSVTEVAVCILHTLAILETCYGMVHYDVKLQNILLSELPVDRSTRTEFKTAEFRGLGLDYTNSPCFRLVLPGPNDDRVFTVPNRGFIPKIADYGMAHCYALCVSDRSMPSDSEPTISAGAREYSPYHWSKKSDKQGYDEFGINGTHRKGYDCFVLLAVLRDFLIKWFSENEPDDYMDPSIPAGKVDNHPVSWLCKKYGCYTNDDTIRPMPPSRIHPDLTPARALEDLYSCTDPQVSKSLDHLLQSTRHPNAIDITIPTGRFFV